VRLRFWEDLVIYMGVELGGIDGRKKNGSGKKVLGLKGIGKGSVDKLGFHSSESDVGEWFGFFNAVPDLSDFVVDIPGKIGERRMGIKLDPK
jgi:hypothetical protein